jgi:hypothetical protein
MDTFKKYGSIALVRILIGEFTSIGWGPGAGGFFFNGFEEPVALMFFKRVCAFARLE